jgi:hypothetical protein
MIRVIIQESPSLFALAIFPGDPETLGMTFEREGHTYYRAEIHHHYVLYKKAVSGWGKATGNDGMLPDARQR